MEAIPIEYLEEGIYTCEPNKHVKGQEYYGEKTYNFSHEGAVGFMLAAHLDYVVNDPQNTFIMQYQNPQTRGIQYKYEISVYSDLNLEENTEILTIVDNFTNINFWDYNITKQYRGIVEGDVGKAVVQFQTPNFVSGFVAYYRDFGKFTRGLEAWSEIYNEEVEEVKFVYEVQFPF